MGNYRVNNKRIFPLGSWSYNGLIEQIHHSVTTESKTEKGKQSSTSLDLVDS